MYKIVRTSIMKILMTYKDRHHDSKVLLLEDGKDETVAALVEVFRGSNRKMYKRTVTVTIQEDTEEVKL